MRYLFPVIAGAGGAAVLVSLGLWQLDRLAWKETVLAEIEARMSAAATPVPVPAAKADHQYLPVAISGMTGAEELHVLVSQKQVGAGFRIITALETDDGRRLLLDHGFMRQESKALSRPPRPIEVEGNLLWPDERDRFTPENDPAANFWFARDLEDMAQRLHTEPTLVVARTLSPPQPGVAPLPIGTEGIPNNHLGYAVQWFGMAIVWLGMTALLIRRISRRATMETQTP
ncbi:MAG: SURF1 family protein [Pseudomonadota bacterium]